MLRLSGYCADKFFITTPEGREIVVSIEQIKSGGHIGLGFEADREVRIDREVTHWAREADRRNQR